MSTRYRPPATLGAHHRLDDFECRSTEQTDWLRRYARQSAGTGTSRVFAVTPRSSTRVVAYYAWCMANIEIADSPPRLRRGAGRHPQPVALLARLGVDRRHEARGIGAGLLKDVIARTRELSAEIGCRGLLVHAETAAARDFYTHLVPEFEASPTDDLHLVLLMKHIRRTLLG